MQSDSQQQQPSPVAQEVPGTKLFVGGLSFNITEDVLKQQFSQYGEVDAVRIIVNNRTGQSKGFGFITFKTADNATDAREKLNGVELDGRRIRVDPATENPNRGRGGFRGGGYRGGRGGGYGGGGYGGGFGGGRGRGGGGFRGGYRGGRGGFRGNRGFGGGFGGGGYSRGGGFQKLWWISKHWWIWK